MSTELAMFPLGTVLFPHQRIPLHVFEPRYRVMVEQCLADDQTFGVVLIERGSEVGGGDVRFDVGTLARVHQVASLPGDRYFLVAVGVRRIRVDEWLPDDPYPRARVSFLDDPPASHGLADEVAAVRRALERVLALAGELRVSLERGRLPVEWAVAEDPDVASYQLAALAMLGPLDAQQVLTAPTTEQRLDRLQHALADREALLRAQLGGRS